MAARRRLLRVALVVGGLAAGLLLAEGLVRLLAEEPLTDPELHHSWSNELFFQNCIRPVAHYGFEYRPGRCGTNSEGLLDDERPRTRAPGELRLVLLGDSLSAHRLYVDGLERFLAADLGRPVDVRNHATGGYGTVNEVARYRHRAAADEPDLVLLQFCLNDYEASPVGFHWQGRIRFLNDQSSELLSASPEWFLRSALYRFVLMRLVIGARAVTAAPFPAQAVRVRRALADLAALTREQGRPLVVAIFPVLEPVVEYARRDRLVYDHIRRTLDELGIQYVDLTPVFARFGYADLRAVRGRAVAEDLEGIATKQQLSLPRLRLLMRGWDDEQLGLDWSWPGITRDREHLNFLGHYLAAEALAGDLAPRLAGRGDP